jgi:dimethylargininase
VKPAMPARRFSRAIVRPPGASFAEGLTTAGLGPPDLGLALEQHGAYREALRRSGLEVIELPPDDRHPDSTFVEDTAVLAPRGAILARPGAASRRGEVPAVRAALLPFFPLPASIHAPGTVDGGDVCEAGDVFFVGLSERTNEAGARQLSAWLESHGCEVRLVDIRGAAGLLHLKSGIAALGDRRLAVTEALVERPEFFAFGKVTVSRGEEYAANCLLINHTLIAPARFPRFSAALRALGYPLIELDMSEFRKMDGGLSCLSLRF